MTSKKTKEEPLVLPAGQIAAKTVKAPADQWLQKEYIIFARYSIRDRALLDNDGLKPVNRRILWSMFDSGFTPNGGFIKAARIVGNTMGSFHPHGDSSIADAMARMAQDYSMRVPLVDKSGSVGYVTGDAPAAPRYWEARLLPAAMELLKEIKDGAANLIPTFDGTNVEPELLPVRWPNDIINGTKGIAVGFASNIPSHNPDEVMKAAIAILKNPDLTVKQLLKIMPGPDLPTGGEILEIDGIKEYYETGEGRFVMRGKYKVEHLTRGRVRIEFNELPYGVSAESVMSRIALLQSSQERTVKGKKVVTAPNEKLSKGISKVQDLTDRAHGLRLVIQTTQGYNHLQVINELFKETPLQTAFSVNNTVLIDGFPAKVGVLEVLKNFIDFRRKCTIRRSVTRIGKVESRIHQLDAILAALVDIDKAIAIIRKATDADTARTGLMKTFKLDEEQATYILSMRLRSLTKSDSIALQNEKDTLEKEKEYLESILNSSEVLDSVVEDDLKATAKIIASPRRSVITGITVDEMKEATKESHQASKEADKNLTCYITRFSNGTIMKSAEPFSYAANLKKLVHSPILEQIKMKTQEEIVVVGNDGLGRKIPLSFLINDKPVALHEIGIEIPNGVKLVGVSKTELGHKDIGLSIGTKSGEVKISKTDFPNRSEFPVITLLEGDEIVDTRWIKESANDSYFSFVSDAGNVLLFDTKTVRAAGSKAGGVRGMKLKDDKDAIVAFSVVENIKDPETSLVTYTGYTIKRTPLSEIMPKGRGGMGVATQLFKNGETQIVTAYAGSHITACVSKATKNVVALPMLSKRAARGVDFGIDVMLGASEVFVK